MDKKNMAYRARLLVGRAMADERVSLILSQMIDQRPPLFEQSLNTAYLAVQVAEATGYKGDVAELAISALVHDAGMLMVPDEIFSKHERLNADEKLVARKHVYDGSKMLLDLGFDGWAIEAALLHHERSNGTGYPEGRESPAIPRLVKIIMVCDVYEALTSDRPQRKAFNMYEACSMMSIMPLSGATLQAIKRCDDT